MATLIVVAPTLYLGCGRVEAWPLYRTFHPLVRPPIPGRRVSPPRPSPLSLPFLSSSLSRISGPGLSPVLASGRLDKEAWAGYTLSSILDIE
uniref:Uncharacterized protein n=1 Tax=Thermogemmatispora argillosa TaxID=2045280 RepID=A0A455SXY6_9CHLR|nr:hypothetical protein KTA_14160 [Thermogemmatispora argillosa]